MHDVRCTYSYQLDNTKFKNAFDFTFNSTLELLYYIENIHVEYCSRNIDTYKTYLWTCKEKNDCRVLCFNHNPCKGSFGKLT